MRQRKSGPGVAAFDKVPRWVARSPTFRTMGELECKLLLFFASRRGWTNNTVPLTTYEELGGAVGARWRRVKTALDNLSLLGAIRHSRQARRLRIELLFADPYSHRQTAAEARCSPRELEGEPSTQQPTKRDGRSDQTGRRKIPNGTASLDDVEDPPAWVTERQPLPALMA